MISVDTVQRLLRTPWKPDETLMLHGTSIESLLACLSRGRFSIVDRIHDATYPYQGFMFFVPHEYLFRGHPLWQELGKTSAWPEAYDYVKINSNTRAPQHFVVRSLDLKYTPDSLSDINFSPLTYEFLDALKIFAAEVGLSTHEARVLLQEANRRKGVILGFGPEARELEIERGKDDPDLEVCVYLPDGLDTRYITKIQPLGPIERKLLQEYIIQNT